MLVQRARILLLAAEGISNTEIAQRVGISRPTVISCRRRYVRRGVDWRPDRPRPARPQTARRARRAETFKFSTDPELAAKVHDVVGLYLHPTRAPVWPDRPEQRMRCPHATRSSSGSSKQVGRAYPRRQLHLVCDNLIAAISRFCVAWNQRCQLFPWTKPAHQILTKLNRQTTSATQH